AILSHRYISHRFLPDKAIDLVDEAASKLRMEATSMPVELDEVRRRITQLEIEREGLRKEKDTASRERLERLEKELADAKEQASELEARWKAEIEKLINMEVRLRERVVGQDEAIVAVANTVRAARAGLQDPNRPIGSFLFLGPTGVGKTETARALAEFLFDDEQALVRIDMSEYQERHTVSRLIG